MILIADSGSTKTSWCLIRREGLSENFLTEGINPFFRNTNDIAEELINHLLPKTGKNVGEVYFYGAGVVNPEKGEIVKKALLRLFPNAEIEVQSDLLAAARATLGREKGSACILGTGSNSCLYNGNEIVGHVPPLGFILGDEGSGAVLGRKLAGDFLKGIMPENISEKFQQKFQINYAGFLEGVYKNEKPNQFLAQFVPFLKENITDVYCNDLICKSFEEFLKRNVFRYPAYRDEEISFVGSVAYYFREQLENVLNENHLQIKTVLKEPISGLVKYHTLKK